MNFKTATRRLETFAFGALAGGAGAGLVALAETGTVFGLAAYAATVPLFLAALGRSLGTGLIAALAGFALLFAAHLPQSTLFFIAADAVPALALSFLALRLKGDGGESGLLTLLALYPCLIFLCLFALALDHPGGLLGLTQKYFFMAQPQIEKIASASGEKITPELSARIHMMLAFAARLAPALAMAGWFASTALSLVFAQAVLQGQGKSRRPPFALKKITVPTWIIFALAITGIAALAAPAPYDYLGVNLALLLGLPFFFVGLAVAHCYAGATRAPGAVLLLFYVALGLVPHLGLVVALLGALDPWFDFRKRLADRNNPSK